MAARMTHPKRTPSMSSRSVAGSVEPRLWTKPLRELTPDTSYGFDLIDFADAVLGRPFDPWQEWLSIHVGELLPDGRPRFRNVLVLVSRQNGKSYWAKALTLFWMAVEEVPLVLATNTDRSYAKRAWKEINEIAAGARSPKMAPTIRQVIGEEQTTIGASAYIFAANNDRAGRSTTVHRWLCDEICVHDSFDTWEAADGAMTAVDDAQTVAISNQGDASAVLLDSLRGPAIAHIESGHGDERLGLFEWSAPDGADPTDVEALAMANPDLGNRVQVDALVAAGRRAKAAGGEQLAKFRTNHMCQRVSLLDPAIDEHSWAACAGTITRMADHRARVGLGLDVSPLGDHATLVAAVIEGGRCHVDVVKEWDGYGAVSALKRDLAGEVAQVHPGAVGWLPNGPTAALAAELRSGWAPAGTRVEELKSDLPAVCMGLAEQVADGEICHGGDPMLAVHITRAQKLYRGDAWVFGRSGDTPVDGAYATAVAVHLARTMPPPPVPLKLVTVKLGGK